MELELVRLEFGTKEWRTGRSLAGIDEIQQELSQIVLTQCLLLSIGRRTSHRWRLGVVSHHRDAILARPSRVYSSRGSFVTASVPRSRKRRPCTALGT